MLYSICRLTWPTECVLLCMLGMETARPCFNVRWQIPLQRTVLSKSWGILSCKLESMGNSDLAVTAQHPYPYLSTYHSVHLFVCLPSFCLFVHVSLLFTIFSFLLISLHLSFTLPTLPSTRFRLFSLPL